jgi:hypothetical protein
MRTLLRIPDLELNYVRCLARLGALKYAQAQTEERLHLPHAANDLPAAQIRERRDSCLREWKSKKQQIANILAPYYPSNQTP